MIWQLWALTSSNEHLSFIEQGGKFLNNWGGKKYFKAFQSIEIESVILSDNDHLRRIKHFAININAETQLLIGSVLINISAQGHWWMVSRILK